MYNFDIFINTLLFMVTLLCVRYLVDYEVNKIRRLLLGEVKSNSYQVSEIKCK